MLSDGGIDIWVASESSLHQNVKTLFDKLDSASPEKPVVDAPQPNLMSNFLFIFTSGTTGRVQIRFIISCALLAAEVLTF